MITFGFAYASNPKIPGFRTYGTVATEQIAQKAIMQKINKEGVTFEQSKDGKTRAVVNGEKTGYMYFDTSFYVAITCDGKPICSGTLDGVTESAENWIKRQYKGHKIQVRKRKQGKKTCLTALMPGDKATDYLPDVVIYKF